MSLSCNAVRDLVAVYKDGAASEETGEEIREHLKGCPDCRQYYREYERIDRVVYVPDYPHATELRYAALASRIRRSRFIQSLVTIGSMAALAAFALYLLRLVLGRRGD